MKKLYWIPAAWLLALTNGLAQSPPGIVIAHAPAAPRAYLGSPSLTRLPGGGLAVAHDFFGPGTKQDTGRIYESRNNGETWSQIAEIQGMFWSSLFVHGKNLYLLGPNKSNGSIVIRKSADEGRTWTEPRDRHSGLLRDDAGYHCAPTPIIVHRGRIWRGFEDVMGPGGWGTSFRSFMFSADEKSDLLQATNWVQSNRIGRDPQWLEGKFGGWLEGNAVVDPDGKIVNILRVDFLAHPEKAAIIRISSDGKEAKFDPADGFIDFPGGAKKFVIRPDPQGGGYWTLSNHVMEQDRKGNPARTRNTLALMHSVNLRTWTVRSILLHHPDTLTHGFQYPDWMYDGEDIIAAVRTAFDDKEGGAHNQHDSNYITFHRWKNFRALTMERP